MKHDRPEFPLLTLRDRIRSEGPLDAAATRRLADALGSAAAEVRGTASYYADLHSRTDAPRVCRGTSCILSGSDEIYRRLSAIGPCERVYCVGYCDRSPAVLRPDGTVVGDSHLESAESIFAAPTSPPAVPSIRSLVAEPIVTARISRGDHSALDRARAAGVYEGLAAALRCAPAEIVGVMERSGERGRGGAAFPTGTKWRMCASTPADARFVIANGDEGDPGSFIDRALMEEDPHTILEGLAICAYAIGAKRGIVFIRSEYPRARERVETAIGDARRAGILGDHVLGSDLAFDVTVFPGLGSYVCGEETAMLNAIEGRRGEVRLRPPYPAVAGLHGRPTVIDNVETLVNVPWIMRRGAEAFTALGTRASSGTKAICLNRGFARPGIVEVEFGTSLREIVESAAGGGRDGRPLAAVLLGGPMGSVLPPAAWDVPVCYGAMAERRIQLGHGGLVAVPRDADFAALLRNWIAFMRDESCGKCVPCSIGSRRASDLAEDLHDADRRDQLLGLFDVIAAGSLCAFGQLIPGPVRELIEHFGDAIFANGADESS
jgi:NADH:ubiquinone oxidoreductase subunit F (NADH-binding)/NADH:ubiquinone oxidoreductase subunit E